MHRNILPFIPYRFKGEAVPCPVCASKSHSLVARMDRRLKPLRTVMCDDCGLFYSNPMPTKDELTTYYQKEYRKDYQLALLKPSEKHVKKKRNEAKARYANIRAELTRDKLSLLDFGCGSGELVHEYASHGHDAHGFEPGATYSSFAQQTQDLKIDIQSTDYQTAIYGSKQFDAISMLHVLEHIPNPKEALSKAYDWLKDDGVLYIEVPNMQAYELKGFEHFHFAHVLGFSRDNLIHALRLSGFRVRKEFDGTSLIAEKAFDNPCVALIDLKVTAERNLREYTQPISAFSYLKYHLMRGIKRLKTKKRNHAASSSNADASKRNTKLAIPPL
jgi:2-polyprenyl-3-methyl-5-hydroxy-6-metoxy-1,4-benzoquinol methylase